MQELLDYYNSRLKRDSVGTILQSKARVRLTDSRQALLKVEAPQVAAFSSRGPVFANTITSVVADLLKPDLMAPGNEVWGAWSPSAIDVAGFTGTNIVWFRPIFNHNYDFFSF